MNNLTCFTSVDIADSINKDEDLQVGQHGSKPKLNHDILILLLIAKSHNTNMGILKQLSPA
jgi:hypothetical protein